MDVQCTYKKSIIGDQLLRTQTNTWHRLPGKSNKNVWKFSTDKYFYLLRLALFVFFTLFCFFLITELILNKKQNNQIIEWRSQQRISKILLFFLFLCPLPLSDQLGACSNWKVESKVEARARIIFLFFVCVLWFLLTLIGFLLLLFSCLWFIWCWAKWLIISRVKWV